MASNLPEECIFLKYRFFRNPGPLARSWRYPRRCRLRGRGREENGPPIMKMTLIRDSPFSNAYCIAVRGALPPFPLSGQVIQPSPRSPYHSISVCFTLIRFAIFPLVSGRKLG
jgi:hypothetical protein